MSQYLGNKNTKKFHDRNNPNDNCQLGEIKDWVYFSTRPQARRAGYEECDWCLGHSGR